MFVNVGLDGQPGDVGTARTTTALWTMKKIIDGLEAAARDGPENPNGATTGL